MKSKQILSLSLAACLTIGSLAGAGEAQAKAKAKAKKPVLSKTKMTAYIGKTKTLKVKKNGTKKIVKTKWTLSGKKVAKLSKKKKTSVTIKGLKKGSATVKAKVWYQKKGAKKKKKVTIPESITVQGVEYDVTSIGEKAFSNCKKLTLLEIKTKKLTKKTVAKKTFKSIRKKTVIKVPKSKYKAYKKVLRARGLNKKVKIKK